MDTISEFELSPWLVGRGQGIHILRQMRRKTLHLSPDPVLRGLLKLARPEGEEAVQDVPSVCL
ncbi:hypothetical protein [Rhizobium binxianense]